jgi:hypothetical protein
MNTKHVATSGVFGIMCAFCVTASCSNSKSDAPALKHMIDNCCASTDLLADGKHDIALISAMMTTSGEVELFVVCREESSGSTATAETLAIDLCADIGI